MPVERTKIKDTSSFATERNNKTGEYRTDLIQSIIDESLDAGVDPYLALGVAMQETNLGEYFSDAPHMLNENRVMRDWDLAKESYAGWEGGVDDAGAWNQNWALSPEKFEKQIAPAQQAVQDADYARRKQALAESTAEYNLDTVSNNKTTPWISGLQGQYIDAAEQSLQKAYANRTITEDEFNNARDNLMVARAEAANSPETQQNSIRNGVRLLRDKLETGQRLYPNGSDAKKIQAYNGYGIVPGGNYGSSSEIDTRKNPVYGERVVAYQGMLRQSPEINELVARAYEKRRMANYQK